MPTTTAYTLCFVHDADRLLLIDRDADRIELPSLLNGLGGKLHPGESPTAAARREIREESGLLAIDLVCRGTESWICTYPDGALKDQGTLYLFTCCTWQGAAREVCPEGALIWLPIADALTHPRLAPNLTTILPALLEAPARHYCGLAHYRAAPEGTYDLIAHSWTGW